MNVNNNLNLNLVKYSAILSSLILLNYVFWSLNVLQVIKFINFYIILFVFLYFFISKNFNNYAYLKIITLLLIIICLGSPTIPIDSRSIYLFSAKMLFYESNMSTLLDNYFSLDVTARPKLPATLSATFAQIIGFWNEIYPKTTNVLIIFPPIVFLIAYFKEKVLIMLWIFLMLFFSGKLFINGLMDGIIGLYFVSSLLIIYTISDLQEKNQKKLFYFILFIFFSILSLCKNEGAVMIGAIFISNIVIDYFYNKTFNFKIFITTVLSLVLVFFWKYKVLSSNMKFSWVQTGNPIGRIFERLTNTDELLIILSFIIRNDKLILSLTFFTIVAFMNFHKNKKLIFFICINFFIYFSAIILAYLVTPYDLLFTLEASSIRVFIPLVLMLVYFPVLLLKNAQYFNQRNTLD